MYNLENLFGGLSTVSDFVDLVQPVNYLVIALPAQNGFCIRPGAHQRHGLAGLGPRYRDSFERHFAASTTVFTRRTRQHHKGMTFGPRFACVG